MNNIKEHIKKAEQEKNTWIFLSALIIRLEDIGTVSMNNCFWEDYNE